MDDHHSGPVELGATMDYREHEKTYDMFVAGSKGSLLVLTALMVAMAAGFMGGAGFFGGLVVFIALTAAGFFLLR